jgi:hypothetical protein
MANPYVLVGNELNIISGARSPVVLKELKPPKPPIRQLPLPVVLFPFLKKGS